MADLQILAVDGINITEKSYKTGARKIGDAQNARDYDITLTVQVDGVAKPVTRIRVNEATLHNLHNTITNEINK